jgi:hypothetical protein
MDVAPIDVCQWRKTLAMRGDGSPTYWVRMRIAWLTPGLMLAATCRVRWRRQAGQFEQRADMWARTESGSNVLQRDRQLAVAHGHTVSTLEWLGGSAQTSQTGFEAYVPETSGFPTLFETGQADPSTLAVSIQTAVSSKESTRGLRANRSRRWGRSTPPPSLSNPTVAAARSLRGTATGPSVSCRTLRQSASFHWGRLRRISTAWPR